jgi:gluconolactonase
MKPKALFAIVWCFLGSVLISGQTPPQQPSRETIAPDIPGVVAAGTKVQLIWTGFQSADGIVGAPDGSLLFAEEPASRISRIDNDGKVSTWLENTNGAGALAIDSKGRLFANQRHDVRVGILSPTTTVLASGYEGEPLKGANDLVVDKRGGVYFTESGRTPPAVYYINPMGRITRLAGDIERANGIMLSRDEKILYVTSSEVIVAYDIQPDGLVNNRRIFGKLEGNGADGLAIDSMGRLYVASPIGVQIFSPQGGHLGVIPTPRPSTTVAFAGTGKKTLYIVGRGAEGPGNQQTARSMYKVSMLAEGFKDRAK